MGEDKIKTVDYVPLHCHSHYSLLDGFCSPDKLAMSAKQMGFRAVALTDHGTCAGLYSFYKACKKNSIKPILGVEAYLVENMDIKEHEENKVHVTLLAKNKQGYKNIVQITSLSYLRGFYSKPRIDFNVLKQYKEGIICGSACIGGIIADPILNGNNIDLAKSNAIKFKELYGDDFFAEIMLHKYEDAAKEERFKKIMRQVYLIAKELNIMAVATCDSHYIAKEDGKMHDIILCISTKDTIKSPKRLSFGSSDFYLKSYDEMMDLYSKSPDLVTNSVKIADKIEDDIIDIGKDLLPDFHLPPGEKSEKDYLQSLVYDGLKARGLSEKPQYQKRIEEELEIINGCGFAKYFLILWDVIAFAKREKIRCGAGRGSGVASLCLYCLGITQLDPIKYDLMFWRFLNKDRVSPPDVDMDFEYTRQEEIFKYVQSKYGIQCTTRIGTYNGLKAKDAVRRVAKVLDIGGDFETTDSKASWKSGEKTLAIIDGMTKAIPNIPNIKLQDVLNFKVKGKTNAKQKKQFEEIKEFAEKYPYVFECAQKVEGTLSAAGVHPAGIIVCKDPIVEHVPLRLAGNVICTQYNLKEVEELGLLKFDFLALKTLTLMEHCIRLIEQRRWGNKKAIHIDDIEPNDKKVFEMLNNGDTDGVFQFEGWGITKLVQNLHIDTFNDMIVANAMYRPGTLSAGIHDDYCDYKHGKKAVEYVHPKMKDLLSETYGMMCFQEDVMKVSMEIAGFTPIEADTLRKGIGKKEPEKIMKLKEKFIDGCITNGVDKEAADKIFELCKYFGGYGFNKCLSGSTKVFNKIDKKNYSLEDLCKDKVTRVVLDSYVNGKCVEDDVVEVFETGEKDVYEIELSNGMKIESTLDHKFICSDGKPHTVKQIADEGFALFCEKECKIISIKSMGKKKTYNVTMKSEQHNYKITDGVNSVYTKNSHSAAYSFIAYQSAWLKYHFRPEFMCALLSSVISEQDKEQREKYEQSLSRFGLELLSHDINLSKDVYTIEGDGGIRPPLSALRGIGVAAIKDIIGKQPYSNMEDFAKKHSSNSGVSKSILSTLIDAGCMKSWGKEKREIIEFCEKYKAQARTIATHQKRKEQKDKQYSGSLYD